MNKEVKIDNELIAYCGLYCGSCSKFMNDKCPGCRKNEKAAWCKIRTCCSDNNYNTCADCQINTHDCKKFNNFFSKLFGYIFKSDRDACIRRIKYVGEENYAKEMAEKGVMTIKKGCSKC